MSGTRWMVLQSFTAGGNQSYLDFWVVTDDPLYPGYKTLTIAPKASVERVARAVHLMGGRIGTHMLPWVPP
jgi:hypothetical protein